MDSKLSNHSEAVRPLSRIAPTPSGFLHLGNALSFVYTRLLTDTLDGTMLLRIDDLDRERYRPDYLEDIFRVLDWLGLELDGGPSGPDDFEQNFRQELRMGAYQEALDQLKLAGLLFACDCSRKTYFELNGAACRCHSSDLSFDGSEVAWRWRNELPDTRVIDLDGETHALSLQETMPFPVLRQKGGRPSYQIASLCDDHDTGVNLLVRGADLLSSTAFQQHMARALSWERFSESRSMHHPLLLRQGEKISKSAGSDSFHAWRSGGWQANEFYAKISEPLRPKGANPENYAELLDLIDGHQEACFRLIRALQGSLAEYER